MSVEIDITHLPKLIRWSGPAVTCSTKDYDLFLVKLGQDTTLRSLQTNVQDEIGVGANTLKLRFQISKNALADAAAKLKLVEMPDGSGISSNTFRNCLGAQQQPAEKSMLGFVQSYCAALATHPKNYITSEAIFDLVKHLPGMTRDLARLGTGRRSIPIQKLTTRLTVHEEIEVGLHDALVRILKGEIPEANLARRVALISRNPAEWRQQFAKLCELDIVHTNFSAVFADENCTAVDLSENLFAMVNQAKQSRHDSQRLLALISVNDNFGDASRLSKVMDELSTRVLFIIAVSQPDIAAQIGVPETLRLSLPSASAMNEPAIEKTDAAIPQAVVAPSLTPPPPSVVPPVQAPAPVAVRNMAKVQRILDIAKGLKTRDLDTESQSQYRIAGMEEMAVRIARLGSVVVTGRPGSGKTTLLHWVYFKLSQAVDRRVILIDLQNADWHLSLLSPEHLACAVLGLPARHFAETVRLLIEEHQLILLIDHPEALAPEFAGQLTTWLKDEMGIIVALPDWLLARHPINAPSFAPVAFTMDDAERYCVKMLKQSSWHFSSKEGDTDRAAKLVRLDLERYQPFSLTPLGVQACSSLHYEDGSETYADPSFVTIKATHAGLEADVKLLQSNIGQLVYQVIKMTGKADASFNRVQAESWLGTAQGALHLWQLLRCGFVVVDQGGVLSVALAKIATQHAFPFFWADLIADMPNVSKTTSQAWVGMTEQGDWPDDFVTQLEQLAIAHPYGIASLAGLLQQVPPAMCRRHENKLKQCVAILRKHVAPNTNEGVAQAQHAIQNLINLTCYL